MKPYLGAASSNKQGFYVSADPLEPVRKPQFNFGKCGAFSTAFSKNGVFGQALSAGVDVIVLRHSNQRFETLPA